MRHQIELGTKTFGMEDQLSMAQWCGDHNPLHVDPVTARRLITGRPVVHGMHVVLEALHRWSPHATPFTALRAEFAKPVSVGDAASFFAMPQGDTTVLLVRVAGVDHMRFTLTQASSLASDDEALAPGQQIDWPGNPLSAPVSGWLGRVVVLPSTTGGLPAAVGAASLIGADGAALLGQLSTLVGMACPGLHSVFSSLDIRRRASPTAARFQVRRFDERFRLVRIGVDGPWSGEVRAFVRASPQPQPAIAEVASIVSRNLPAGHHTWVLGGSRGLGELAAKVAAAAGSEVTLTYATGVDDARRVADEINAQGLGPVHVVKYLAGETDLPGLLSDRPLPRAVLYFATPRIAALHADLFDSRRVVEFVQAYCSEPARLALALERAAQGRSGTHVRIFNPSSTYVSELPAGMVEYAMAKAASEVMAQDLNKRLRHVELRSERLPRLPTDQTNGLFAETGPSALAVMLPVLLGVLG